MADAENLALVEHLSPISEAIFEWLKIFVPPFLAFGLGIIGLIAAKRYELRRLRPFIEIEAHVVTKLIDIKGGADLFGGRPFHANRISVINKGLIGAKDCKAYIRFPPNDIIRTGWMLPDNNTAYTLILNVNIPEYVDLCASRAFDPDKPNIPLTHIITNERGYRDPTMSWTDYAGLPWDRDVHATLIIASSNAPPAERGIIFHVNPIPDDDNPGKIVEVVAPM